MSYKRGGVPEFVKEYITQNNIKHPNQAVLAPAHLYLVKEILEDPHRLLVDL